MTIYKNYKKPRVIGIRREYNGGEIVIVRKTYYERVNKRQNRKRNCIMIIFLVIMAFIIAYVVKSQKKSC